MSNVVKLDGTPVASPKTAGLKELRRARKWARKHNPDTVIVLMSDRAKTYIAHTDGLAKNVLWTLEAGRFVIRNRLFGGE